MSQRGAARSGGALFADPGQDGLIHRGFLRGQGYSAQDVRRSPVIGICSSWSELNPCNAGLHTLATAVKRGSRAPSSRPLPPRYRPVPGLLERDAGHGRKESRSIKVIDLDGTPEAGLFPHGARAIKVVRRRRRSGRVKASVETVYAITSLGHRDADPRLLAGWLRSHWTIENSLHWVRDVTEGEDHSRVRTGNGPQAMAALRNTAINIIRLRGGTNIAAAHRHFSYRPADALDALTTA